MYEFRYATMYDVDAVKTMLDRNKAVFGFLPMSAVRQSVSKGELYLAMTQSREAVGFCRFHRKLDGQTTIYEIFVNEPHRCQGIASRFVDCLKEPILAKCPVGLQSNEFYRQVGFTLIRIEQGKKRQLNVWIKGGDFSDSQNVPED